MASKLSPKKRLVITIAISFAFFVAEITVAFLTKSLALFADAFHYMNDLLGFIVALTALVISERSDSPQDLSFGWQRAQLLGAFFNGVFLLALGISIFLQSIERFISIEHIENPKLVMIMGCVGLCLNIISASFLHEHHGHDHSHGHGHGHSHQDGDASSTNSGIAGSHELRPDSTPPHAEHRHNVAKLKSPGRDLGMLGVFIHVLGDALNNLGVIIAAVVIWQTRYPARFYADPGVSMGIALMILITALPLVKNSGTILLQSAPRGVDISDVKHDIEKIPGIESVHELHIWRLDQKKAIASAHVVVSGDDVADFMAKARTISQCLHAYGIHSATLQPELSVAAVAGEEEDPPDVDGGAAALSRTVTAGSNGSAAEFTSSSLRRRRLDPAACQVVCASGGCENLMCCTNGQL